MALRSSSIWNGLNSMPRVKYKFCNRNSVTTHQVPLEATRLITTAKGHIRLLANLSEQYQHIHKIDFLMFWPSWRLNLNLTADCDTVSFELGNSSKKKNFLHSYTRKWRLKHHISQTNCSNMSTFLNRRTIISVDGMGAEMTRELHQICLFKSIFMS